MPPHSKHGKNNYSVTQSLFTISAIGEGVRLGGRNIALSASGGPLAGVLLARHCMSVVMTKVPVKCIQSQIRQTSNWQAVEP